MKMFAARFLCGILCILGACVVRVFEASPIGQSYSINTLSSILSGNCEPVPLNVRINCFKRPYRTFDGSCNNLCNISRGVSSGPFQRLLPPAFGEGFAPRKLASNNLPLPNARSVSFVVFNNTDSNLNNMAPNFTHMAMAFGVFVDHDLTLTEANDSVECGTNDEVCSPADGCIGIDLFVNQALQDNITAQCIPLRRNSIRRGEQVNLVTSYLEGSQVYGSNCRDSLAVRDLKANLGLLRVQPFPATSAKSPLLPPTEPTQFCRSPKPMVKPCFLAGDERVNENQGLAVIHTIFAREHNRVAIHLHNLNPYWGNERLFQEARKIVIAQIQHITYNEWLPSFFSEDVLREAGILLETDGPFNGYDPNVDATVFNSFAAAALRMGHSLIRNEFAQLSRNFAPRGTIPVKNFFDPVPLYSTESNGIGGILLGLVTELGQKIDPNFVSAVRENLIIEGQGFNGIVGDLPAINIQRGRDHGIPPYVLFRRECGLGDVYSFQDLSPIISTVQVERLSSVYNSPADIDLFAGGMSESPAHGSLIGPTFTCIMIRQFRKLRDGDRFWYERNDSFIGFTAAQLSEIRKSSLARVICDNSDGVNRIPRKVFQAGDNRVNCYQIDSVHLNEWKEDPETRPPGKESCYLGSCLRESQPKEEMEPTSEEASSITV